MLLLFGSLSQCIDIFFEALKESFILSLVYTFSLLCLQTCYEVWLAVEVSSLLLDLVVKLLKDNTELILLLDYNLI